MSSVVIHGASDDLIEVLGDTLEERILSCLPR
jgi:hypothetical protein